ncbi:unnamed protein product, partial [Iphiclides podalirius]
MNGKWLKVTQNVQKGIQIINQLEDIKFEPFLRRIATKLRLQESEVFTEGERNKLQVVFKKDLLDIGFKKEKAEFIVKVWSLEISSTLNDLVSKANDKCDNNQNFSWKLNTELSSDIHKRSKVPKAYLLISDNNLEQEMELTHSDLYTVFIQLESIQNELDNVVL